MIAITEFITRLEQGFTEAFLCRGEDGWLYVVKSRKSGKESLVREWICGSIARRLGLPVPPFELVFVSDSVAVHSGNELLEALAETPGFGSRFVASSSGPESVSVPMLNPTDVRDVDPQIRRRVLLFDWWVRNFDRIDDNPNLLWDPIQKALHVIDHNLAFDPEPAEVFWTEHIFRDDRTALLDPALRATDLPIMETILVALAEIWAAMPDSWTEASTLTLTDVDRILRRCTTDEFWSGL